MSGGGGKGGGSQQVSSYAADTLADIAKQFATETEGLRTGFTNVLQEVLHFFGNREVTAGEQQGFKGHRGRACAGRIG